MDERPPHRQTRGEPPRAAASGHPLDVRRRGSGPGELAGKIGLATLGLILLFAITAAFWAAMVVTHRDDIQPPDAHIEER